MRHLVLATGMVLAAALTLACGSKDKGPGPAQTENRASGSPSGSSGSAAPGLGGSASGATDDGDGVDCVAECVLANQMKAVGPAQIEADCRTECAGNGSGSGSP